MRLRTRLRNARLSLPRQVAGLRWLSALALLALAACSTEERPPSLILISIDTLRADHVGAYGYERDTTPRLDRLAEESVLFERCYAVAPWTLISHMTMLTGLYPKQHGVLDKRNALSPDVPALAERLRARGYQTWAIYHPGWIHERHGFDRGFDRFVPHANAAEAERNLEALMAERDSSRPLFLFVHLFDVHCAPLDRPETTFYEPPEPYDRMFLGDAPERLEGVSLDADAVRAGITDPAVLETLTALYDGGIRYVDDVVGGWLDGWRAEGLLDEALLVVTSDHGESLGQRGGELIGHGGLWEEGLRVPFLVRFPDGRLAGERVDEPISHVDLLPTLLVELDLPGDPRLPGYPLFGAPGVEGAATPEDRVLKAERPPVDVWLSDNWKLVRGSGGGGTAYDLDADPDEARPIRARKDARFEELYEELAERFANEQATRTPLDAVPGEASDLSEASKARLEALGYAGDT